MRIVAVFGCLVVTSLAFAAAACTTTYIDAPPTMGDDAGVSNDDAGGADSGKPVVVDAGKKDANVILPSAMAAPQILNIGGSVMKTPKIVPIFYPGEPYVTELTTFITNLAGSSYWTATTSEYGVGPVTAGASHTMATAAPTTIDDAEIKTFLTTQLDGAHGWGMPDPSTIYTIYYPSTTTITLMNATSCSAFGGYHNEVTIGATRVVYAVMPRCSAGGSDLDYLTSASTHEFIEAVTDPHPFTGAAFNQPDDDHLVWALFPISEVGDMCTFNTGAEVNLLEIGYVVQRTWSNKAAAAHHNPCVPAPAGRVYFNSVPMLKDTVNIDLSGGMGGTGYPTKGVAVPVGTSKTIDVSLFADGSTGPWTVQAVDYEQYMKHASPDLSFAIDKTQGSAGDTLRLTITRNAAGAYGGSAFILSSSQGASNQNLWVGFAGN